MGGGASDAQPIQPQLPAPQAPSNPPPPEQPPANKKGKDIKTGAKIAKKISKKVKQKSSSEVSKEKPDSKQQESQPEQQKPKQIIFKSIPKCINNKPSSHLCLSKKCTEYPFFCMNCQGSCNEAHIHNRKQISASLKEFQSRIQGRKQIDENLKQSLQNYKQALLHLKVTFQEFYENQSEAIRQVQLQKQPSPKAIMLRRKIDRGEKKGLTGQMISELWNEQRYKWVDQEQKWITNLNQKQQLLIGMCECFLKINSIQEQIKQQIPKAQQHKPIQTPKKKPQAQKKQEKAWHIFKRYQFDKQRLKISKQNSWSNAKKPLE